MTDQASKKAFKTYTIFVLLLLSVTTLTYMGSFKGAFVFDDHMHIKPGPQMDSLWPLSQFNNSRGVPTFTTRLNYAINGMNTWGYHLVNLIIHLTCMLSLFFLIITAGRIYLARTLKLKTSDHELSSSAAPPLITLAFISSLLWAIHPIQTQAVTYIIQRHESIMVMFFVLTLLFLTLHVRIKSKPGKWAFAVLTIIACYLGMRSKQVMVTAPFIALLMDCCLLTGSIKTTLKKRWWLHLLLFLSILSLFSDGLIRSVTETDTIKSSTPKNAKAVSAGFGYGKVGPMDYAKSQFGVILHYLRLIFWPDPLVLDYGWPVARTWQTFFPQAVTVLGMAAGSIYLLFKKAPFNSLGFLGFSFFFILAPTSTIMPIADLAMEHRMYGPSMCLIVLLTLLGFKCHQALLRRHTARQKAVNLIAAALLLIIAVALAMVTDNRNKDYESSHRLWLQNVTERPDNPRAHLNFANTISTQDPDRAIEHYTKALELRPLYPEALNNIASAYHKKGDNKTALKYFEKAVSISYGFSQANANLASMLSLTGDDKGAVKYFRQALEINPHSPHTHNNLAITYFNLGQTADAITHFKKAVAYKPDMYEARLNLAALLAGDGKMADANKHLAYASKLRPDDVKVKRRLATNLILSGKRDEGLKELESVIDMVPDLAIAHCDFAAQAHALGKRDLALKHFKLAHETNPKLPRAMNGYAVQMAMKGDIKSAIPLLNEAMKIDPKYPEAHCNMGNVLFKLKKYKSAEILYRKALELRADYPDARNNLIVLLSKLGRKKEATELLKQEVKAKPQNAKAHADLGEELLAQGKYKEASEYFKKALKISPEMAGVRENLKLTEQK